MTTLLDANVLVALAIADHVHHEPLVRRRHAYLAQLARRHHGRLATLDQGLAELHSDVAELVATL
ncbi:hypothetical protein [Mycobacterium sp.]|uniref:hypothetical protein n=1 Tax=Mycobacterium sp. TaxID=1785 RepID=UPI00127E8D8B|nr:hypothetical protein [Mycobacterium sp.]KAA8963528.1 MAG: type II toxin-antitoxin system VapC family toxin [Mycobacterium sp.]